MPPILLCWPTTLEAVTGSTSVEVEPSRQTFVSFVPVRPIAAEEQSGIMASDMKVRRKQKCVIEFLNLEKIESVDNLQRLLSLSLKLNSGCKQSEAVGSASQQWRH
jgi:hypothetical protein